uniref:Uncharacterized protein n=1 Tax=Chromera velia CCMP2878 TaxID=1169474 RepID=A0A0G4FET1_9ALVE|eukprot:Cvel_16559.t1-p1 / transcript=Cvel_16559.t1 / gene=Cvel_16559 / organism=Chromera_velia_CCMP2878 / gene_product=hypothetical protein / transcript_product=hypothetical protein / location=Cvel_scaffold1281:6239-6901(-) / protein_length=221 / sequence_SO=supercontig / SO=protein_coding / is_pseudo=false
MDTSAIILTEHAVPSSEAISELEWHRDSFGLGWLLLNLIQRGRLDLPFPVLDLSGLSLEASQLSLLLSSLPDQVETLRCGARPPVCKDAAFQVFLSFLKNGPEGRGAAPFWLKSLQLVKCNLANEAAVTVAMFGSLPPSLENLSVEGNRLWGPSAVGAFGKVLSSEGGPQIRSLNLSDNPLGSSGVRALMKALSTQQQDFFSALCHWFTVAVGLSQPQSQQ